MTMWLMRAGKTGERERLALENQLAVVEWGELPDLEPCSSRAELDSLLKAAYPSEKSRTLHNWHGQVWAVRSSIQVGDLVVLPLKSRAEIAIGMVSGDYRYRRDLPGGAVHTRPVKWMAQVPRRAFDVDILLSFGAFMTVCRIERNDAEQRVRELLETHRQNPLAFVRPGWEEQGGEIATCAPPHRTAALREPRGRPPGLREIEGRDIWGRDLESRLHEMICQRIAQRFKGHQLAVLVAALLEAQGYRARVSPPGVDGGVDILAGSGPFGFDGPRIVVQVKSQDSKVDVRVLRELEGVMGRYQAEHALLVGWGGFNQCVKAEAAAEYFRIRLWDGADVVGAVKEQYDRLPAAIRNEIPLKQVWTLAPNEPAGVAA